GGGSSEEKALLDRVTGYQNLDTKNYQETKDSVTNGAVAVAAITAGAVATIATGGAAAPAEAAIIAALAAGGATIVTKAIIQGATGAVSSGVGNATSATLQGKSMPEILKAGGMGVLTGGAGAATTGALGAGLKGADMFKDMDPIQAAMLRNAIAGGTGAA